MNHQTQPFLQTDGVITLSNRWDHFLARWGVNRLGHMVHPGLYALGRPTPDSPVVVTANYTLSFDAVRSALRETNVYILVLDTKGVNVWCAAGKGVFGVDELVNRIEATDLHQVVNHRVLILPQLSATGVAAHEVKRRSQFKVEYGPVRAGDLPAYLETGNVSADMRRIHFPLLDRLVLIPVELVNVLLPVVIVTGILLVIVGPLVAGAVATAFLGGVVLFPILLPWLPTRDFSSKGFILGVFLALPFAIAVAFSNPQQALWLRGILALACLLVSPAVTAYLALNFTGCTTFTSKSGVKREMFTYLPMMARVFGAGVALTIFVAVFRLFSM